MFLSEQSEVVIYLPENCYREQQNLMITNLILTLVTTWRYCEHRHQIEECYDNMCNVLSSVGKLTIPTCRFRSSQEFIVPGFNEHLKELHGKARKC